MRRNGEKQRKINNNILKDQVNKIQMKEKKRAESIQKYQNMEKANQRRLKKEHLQFIEK